MGGAQEVEQVARRLRPGAFRLAGHETTASTLFWACTLLARSPAIQDALAGEAAGARRAMTWAGG
jgi:cytochrome P450